MLIQYLAARLPLPLLLICSPVTLPAQTTEAPQGYMCYGCTPSTDSAAADRRVEPASYMGRDEGGVPHYIQRPFSAEERQLLREQFGIEDPSRLYLSDSSSHRYLVYDTERDRRGVIVMSARVGAPSVRRPGESWEQLERRVRRMRASRFDPAVRVPDRSLLSLHPAARSQTERMLAAARGAGFRVRVAETNRSLERQAYLLSRRGGRTYTATSRHTGGWAVDVVVGNGNLRHRRTRRQWVEFRRWLLAYGGGSFRIIGTPDSTWDWSHIEISGAPSRFKSVEELLSAARSCAARPDSLRTQTCDTTPGTLSQSGQLTSSPP
jgi:hypothetical protein